MPYCKICGNTRSFGSSHIPPVAPAANGQLSGMVGAFNADHEVVQISSRGASKLSITKAVDKPQEYFDICMNCGNQAVDWQNEQFGERNLTE